jgi:hypothetical protein
MSETEPMKSFQMKIAVGDLSSLEAVAVAEGTSAAAIARHAIKNYLRAASAVKAATPKPALQAPPVDEFAEVKRKLDQHVMRFKVAGMGRAKKKIERFACYKMDVTDPKQLTVAQWEDVFKIMSKIEAHFGFEALVAHIAKEEYLPEPEEESAA